MSVFSYMFPIRLPKFNWDGTEGVADFDINSWEKSISNIAQLALLNASTMGRSVTRDWNVSVKLCNWEKFWDGAAGTGNLIKHIAYSWNVDKLCETETFLFYDYKDDGTLLRTRQCIVTHTWDSNKLCTATDVGDITVL